MARRKNDPIASFNFRLEIAGITKAGFSECTGLNSESNVIEYRDGGIDPITPRKLPGLNKFGNITLKRGVIIDPEVFKWRKSVVDGTIDRKDISIVLLDESRQEAVRWNIRAAWPCKYMGPDFKANANEVAIESIEICHEGVERQ